MTDWINRCHFGDVRAVLRQMIDAGVQVNTIVTSPPYWGLRSYLPGDHHDKALEIGSEPTLADFIAGMVEVFDLARQVLRDDGTLWMNMGDAYATDHLPKHSFRRDRAEGLMPRQRDTEGFKTKDLLGQPWRLAIALQDAGWWLRSDIIWSKPNPMPESAKDRPTKSHEYIFLLAKSESYHFDFEAFSEPASPNTHLRVSQNVAAQAGSMRAHGGDTGKPMKAVARKVAGWAEGAGVSHSPVAHNTGVGWGYSDANPKPRTKQTGDRGDGAHADGKGARMGREPGWRGRVKAEGLGPYVMDERLMRNRRTVWTVPSEPYHGAHFATYPQKLIEPCILAGCPVGGVVLDIFLGSGTTAQVAQRLGRQWIGIDIDERNHALQLERLAQIPLQLEAA